MQFSCQTGSCLFHALVAKRIKLSATPDVYVLKIRLSKTPFSLHDKRLLSVDAIKFSSLRWLDETKWWNWAFCLTNRLFAAKLPLQRKRRVFRGINRKHEVKWWKTANRLEAEPSFVGWSGVSGLSSEAVTFQRDPPARPAPQTQMCNYLPQQTQC